jgi:hypothetical protein
LDIYPGATVVIPAGGGEAAMTLDDLNTQVSEHCNAQLELILLSGCIHGSEQCHEVLQFYLFRYNQKMQAKLS